MIRRAALLIGTLSLLALLGFGYSLFVHPRLQTLPEDISRSQEMTAGDAPSVKSLPTAPRDWMRKHANPQSQSLHLEPGTVRLGFLDDNLDRALISLRQHASRLTHVAPTGLRLHGMPPQLETLDLTEIREAIADQDIALIPRLTNQVADHFDPEAVEHYLRASATEQRIWAQTLRDQLLRLGAQGVMLIWEQIDSAYQNELTQFIQLIHETLQEQRLELWVSIPVGDDSKAFDLDALGPFVERFVATLYYETGEEDPPGPIASQSWFNDWLNVLVDHADPTQWVIGIATFGYDWPEGEDPSAISFSDAMARAASAGVTNVTNPPPFYGPSFTYQLQKVSHKVWFMDATTFYMQQKAILQQGVGGLAVDRLGTEDPAIWQVMACGTACNPKDFQSVLVDPRSIAVVGDGDFLTAFKTMKAGWRHLEENDQDDWILRYERFPQVPYVLRRDAGDKHEVSLTFDDGPDPEWTPKILDLLKAKGINATFFVIGSKAIAHPELIRRILDEGHEIGNHTFNHANLQTSTEWRTRLELNATQRAIESITGRSTLLFRPPYDADRTPRSPTELDPLLIAQGLGYIPVMASIDPLDWQRPTAQELLQRIKQQRTSGNNIVLLHDSGGDRSSTLEALGPIIDYLQRRGDEVVPLRVLLGVPLSGVMPQILANDPAPERLLAGTGLNLWQGFNTLAWWFLALSTGLLMARTLLIALLASFRARSERREPKSTEPFTPAVSILLAAYNEEKVIVQTLESLLASDYPGPLEIIVVDDGSTDRTGAIVEELAAQHPQIRPVRQANRGKAIALQQGINLAQHPFLVMLDADTQFQVNTLRELIQPLSDPQVGAVSCHIRVGNDDTWIARYQALEYLAGFNLDRRAYAALNAITVVPGAASSYRAEAIAAAGGIQPDTLAEDTDLTLALHRVGYQIRHTARAHAVTEAPRTLRALLRQRQRWSFGTLQCLWKHRDMQFSIRYGWLGLFSLPSIWFFHVLLVALVPLVDLTLILSLIRGSDSSLLTYSLIFMAVDVFLALVACQLDGEPWRTSLRIIPMRLVYRPLLALAVLYALQRAMRGTWVGWGVQERWGIRHRKSPGIVS